MREIKFRGKALGDGYNFKAGEFVYGSLVFEGDEPYIVGPVVEANEDYIAHEWWVPVDPATVGQYTGLKDKNGREIYEGDIVKIVTRECMGEGKTIGSIGRRKHLTHYKYADVISIGVVKWGKTQYPYDKVSVYYVDTEHELTYDTYFYQMKSSDPPRIYKTKIKPALEEVKSVEVIGNIHENPELLDVDMSNEIEHDYTDEIVCSWCGYRHSGSYESFCPDCGAKEWIRQLDEYQRR